MLKAEDCTNKTLLIKHDVMGVKFLTVSAPKRSCDHLCCVNKLAYLRAVSLCQVQVSNKDPKQEVPCMCVLNIMKRPQNSSWPSLGR